MTNLWTVLYFTLGITLTGLMLVLFKRLFRDKLSARWHYLVWLVLLVRAILPENLRLFSTGFALNTLWVSWMKRLRAAVELGRNSLLSTPFGMGGGEISLLKKMPFSAWSLTDRLFAVYLAGVAAVLLYDALLYARLRLEIRKGAAATPSLREKIRKTAEKYDLPTQKSVRICKGIETPFLCGMVRPILVVPESMAETIDEKVLLHEMLHLKHHDVLVNFLLHLLQALNWFNPFVYWLCRIIRNDSEALCDQRALERLHGEEKREYGMLLLDMADSRCASRIGTTSMANGARNIKTRIGRIADFGRVPKGAAFATACITVVLCLASVSFAYQPNYFDTSKVETAEDLRLTLEDARYFEIPSAEMAISIFYEAFEERDLAKLALTVPQEEFDTYRDWALAEYKAAEYPCNAYLRYGTKADYKYRFYDSMKAEDFYLLEQKENGSVDGVLQVNEFAEGEKPITQHFLHFCIFEETKGNWSVALLRDESRLFDVYGAVNYGIYKLEEEMAQGSYRQVGDWRVADAAYCRQWGFLFGSNDVMNSLLGINQEMQFNETLAPSATHAAYLEYTGTALREKQSVLLAVLCPQEMSEDEYWESIDSLQVGSGGSSSAGVAWEIISTDEDWDGRIDLGNDENSDNLADAFARLETPYEVRLYTNHKELLETIPLKGGALDAGNNPTKGNNTGKRSTGNNNAGAENK
mgnify:FL=1